MMPERLWQAITDPALLSRYSPGVWVESTYAPDSSKRSTSGPAPVEPGQPTGSLRYVKGTAEG